MDKINGERISLNVAGLSGVTLGELRVKLILGERCVLLIMGVYTGHRVRPDVLELWMHLQVGAIVALKSRRILVNRWVCGYVGLLVCVKPGTCHCQGLRLCLGPRGGSKSA